MAAIIPAKRKAVKFTELSPKQQQAFGTPAGFAVGVLKMELSPKQVEVLQSMGPNRSAVSVVCCNEAGKTTRMVCAFILWHLTVFTRRGDNGGVISTSGSWAQIVNQLIPALRSHAHKFPRWQFNDRSISIGGIPNYMAFSTTDAGRAEGFHGHPEHPLAALVDEAKSVREGIFKAIEERCRPNRLGLLSSPGYSVGRFFDSHTSAAKYYTRHKITVEDCPWIDRLDMRRLIEKAGHGDYEKGLTDPTIRSAYFADFMPFVEGGLLTMADIEECLAEPPQRMHHGGRHCFLDFARGGDENAIGVRNGNKVWLDDSWRDKNTMSAVGRFVTRLNTLKKTIGLQPTEVEGDGDGLGGPMIDAIREAGWPILEFRGGFAATDAHRFKNQISERWFTGAEKIKNRQVILPDDPEMKAQMLDRVALFESSGLRWIESKKDLFKRQAKEQRPKRSPDRADAIFGAMGDLPVVAGQSVMGHRDPQNPWSDDPDYGAVHDESMGVPEEMLRGFDAGN